MSHIVEIKTQIKDASVVAATCARLGLPEPVEGEHRLYGSHATGLAVRLPGWDYPVVFDVRTGQSWYDNYGGQWGKQSELNRFTQIYAVEKACIEASRRGHVVSETTLADGSIRLTVTQR